MPVSMSEKFNDGLDQVRAGIARMQKETLAQGISIHYYIGDRLVEHRPDGTIHDVKLPIEYNHSYDTPEFVENRVPVKALVP
jgi:hypothetical protein